MPKFTIDVLIKGSTNMAKVSAAFTKSTNAIGNSMKSVTKIANTNKKAFQAGATSVDRLSRALGVGLVAAFGAVAHAGASFEVAVKDLSALTGIVGEDLDKLSEEALLMSLRFGESGSKVAGAMKLVASAKSELIGVPGAIEEVTQAALILSKASRVDLATSTKVLTTSMNQFNLGAEEATRVINVLAVGAKLGASEIADTGQAILRAGVASRVAGISFEQTQAAIQVLAKGGLKGVIAGTQFKTMLLRMMQGSDNLNPKIVGLSKAFENLATAQLTGAQYSQLFGLEAMTAGIILTENRELMDRWTKEFTGTNIAIEQATVNMSSLWEAVKRLGTAVQFHLIKAFNKFGPSLSVVIDKLAKFLNMIADPPNKRTEIAIKTLGISFAVAAGSFALLIAEFQIFRMINWWGTVAPAIASINAFNSSLTIRPIVSLVKWIGTLAATMGGSLVTGFAAATAGAYAFTVALLTNPITWIVVAVVALAAGLTMVIRKWDEWGAAVGVLMGPMGLLISNIIEVKDHWKDITTAFQSGGMKDGILAIGKVLTIAILRPMEQLLSLIAKIPGMGFAGDYADKLGAYQDTLFPETVNGPLTDQAAAASGTPTGATSRQELDVNMKIDAEGRPTIDKAESKHGGLNFQSDVGFTYASVGI